MVMSTCLVVTAGCQAPLIEMIVRSSFEVRSQLIVCRDLFVASRWCA